MPKSLRRKLVAGQRERGWKTVTGKYDHFDHRTAEPIGLITYGGLDEVPDPVPLKRLDRHHTYLQVKSCI